VLLGLLRALEASQGALDTVVLDTAADLKVLNGPGSQAFLDTEVECLEDSDMEEDSQQALAMESGYQETSEAPHGMASLQCLDMETLYPEPSAMVAVIQMQF
jgi:hypothetical protein